MKTKHAFSLLEILVVLLIVGLLASIALPGIINQVRDGKISAEDLALNQINTDILRSFDSEDFQNINVAAVPNDIPAGINPTNFYGNPDASFTNMSAPDWFAKIATIRGTAYTSAAPANQPAISSLLYNLYGRARLLVAAPTEANQQRFLLISLMGRAEQLVMPPNDGTQAWFDAIWTTEWNTHNGTVPAYWSNGLNSVQIAAWNGNPNNPMVVGPHGSNLFLLRVIKITLPRYTLRISNNHPSANGYIYWNESPSPLLVSAANSGVTTSPAILGGRVIRVFKGADQPSATETNRFTLRENDDVLIQSSN
jgi:prepilin-type N-terminal cleavage/methylation domain-containing protein